MKSKDNTFVNKTLFNQPVRKPLDSEIKEQNRILHAERTSMRLCSSAKEIPLRHCISFSNDQTSVNRDILVDLKRQSLDRDIQKLDKPLSGILKNKKTCNSERTKPAKSMIAARPEVTWAETKFIVSHLVNQNVADESEERNDDESSTSGSFLVDNYFSNIDDPMNGVKYDVMNSFTV